MLNKTESQLTVILVVVGDVRLHFGLNSIREAIYICVYYYVIVMCLLLF